MASELPAARRSGATDVAEFAGGCRLLGPVLVVNMMPFCLRSKIGQPVEVTEFPGGSPSG